MKKTMESDRHGAMFVSWDTHDGFITVTPASWGLQKHKGCVEFRAKPSTKFYTTRDRGLMLTPNHCKKLYYDVPKEEEAWLVYPVGPNFVWERVDEDMELIG